MERFNKNANSLTPEQVKKKLDYAAERGEQKRDRAQERDSSSSHNSSKRGISVDRGLSVETKRVNRSRMVDYEEGEPSFKRLFATMQKKPSGSASSDNEEVVGPPKKEEATAEGEQEEQEEDEEPNNVVAPTTETSTEGGGRRGRCGGRRHNKHRTAEPKKTAEPNLAQVIKATKGEGTLEERKQHILRAVQAAAKAQDEKAGNSDPDEKAISSDPDEAVVLQKDGLMSPCPRPRPSSLFPGGARAGCESAKDARRWRAGGRSLRTSLRRF